MKIKIDNLKEPKEYICIHCLGIAKRQEDELLPYYRHSYKCDCKKYESTGTIHGVPDFQLFLDGNEKTTGSIYEESFCGLHTKCKVKDKKGKHYLLLTEVNGKYYIENKFKQYEKALS